MLADVQSFVTRRLSEIAGDDKSKFMGALADLLARYNLDDLLQAAISPDTLEAVAQRSYQHPNGFTKVVLIPYTVDVVPFELRVHDWLRTDPIEDGSSLKSESIHDHGWHFASYLAAGGLIYEEFVLSEDGLDFEEYEYVRPSEDIRFYRHLIGTAKLKCIEHGLYSYPDLYFFSRAQLHRTLPIPDAHTVSVLLQGPAVASRGRIHHDRVWPSQREVPPQRSLTTSELIEVVASIRRTVRHSSTPTSIQS